MPGVPDTLPPSTHPRSVNNTLKKIKDGVQVANVNPQSEISIPLYEQQLMDVSFYSSGFVARRSSSRYMKRHGYRTKYHFVLQVKVAEDLI